MNVNYTNLSQTKKKEKELRLAKRSSNKVRETNLVQKWMMRKTP